MVTVPSVHRQQVQSIYFHFDSILLYFSVADPGFKRVGVQTQNAIWRWAGVTDLLFGRIIPKSVLKWKKWAGGGWRVEILSTCVRH